MDSTYSSKSALFPEALILFSLSAKRLSSSRVESILKDPGKVCPLKYGSTLINNSFVLTSIKINFYALKSSYAL